MKKYGVIMAGGVGSRFWPISREKRPKQLLNLSGKDVLINEAIKRLSYTIEKDDIFIVSNQLYKDDILALCKEYVSSNNIISEPEARGTLACVGYSAITIEKKFGSGLLVIVPSDHSIKDIAAFTRCINEAIDLAEVENKIVTIGINPTYPADGYGYIKVSDDNIVLDFKEKPNRELAEMFLNEGNYLWNSGIIVSKSDVMLNKIKEFQPEVYENLSFISNYLGTEVEESMINELFPKLYKNSIDYAILEPASKNNDVLFVRGNFDWTDIGSWDAISNILEKDENKNVVSGDTITIDTTNSIIRTTDKLIAVVGLDNVVVVETKDAILVCNKDNAQDVKMISDILIEKDRKDLI